MTYQVQLVFSHLVEDAHGETAMPTDILKRQHPTVKEAEEFAIAELPRLNAESACISFFNIVDADGDAVDLAGRKF